MNQSSHKDTLSREIKPWTHFEYALRVENRLLFSKMLSEYIENEHYAKAASSEYFSAESLFTVLILQQQNMINELIAKVTPKNRKLGI
jgi:hypothetical protein